MKTPGKTLDDHLARVAKSLPETDLTRLSDVQCEADVVSTNVFLCYHSEYDKKFPHRPYLHIMGKCHAIRGELPYNVNEIAFAEDNGIDVDFFYEFTDAELSDMAAKGLFNKGFRCPEIFFDNDFELPVVCDFSIVNPTDDVRVPIVFAQIQNANNISISEETCGYTFGDYFEKYEPVSEDVYQSDEVYLDEVVEEDFEVEQEEQVEPLEQEENAEDMMLEEHYGAIRDRIQAHMDVSAHVEVESEQQNPNNDYDVKQEYPNESIDDFVDDDIITDDEFSVVDEGRGMPKQVPSKIDDIEAESIQEENSAEKE